MFVCMLYTGVHVYTRTHTHEHTHAYAHIINHYYTLTRLINKLRAAAGLNTVRFSKNAQTPFVAMENIETFNKVSITTTRLSLL